MKNIPLLLLLLTLALAGSGCASTSLPPSLTAAEKARLKGAHLPFTVGVERSEWPTRSDSLLKALRGTGLFDHVDYLDQFSTPPDLVARVERKISGRAMIPIFTLLTFGVVPTIGKESFGHAFSLAPAGALSQRIPITYRHRGTTTLGWLGLFQMVSLEYSTHPQNSRRFRQRLTLTILDHSDALSK